MRKSSSFLKYRQPGDCGNAPRIAAYYTGATAAVPVMVAGNIVFQGATTLSSAGGIGVDGSATELKIPYDSILTGGAGAVVRACLPSIKKKVRFKCCEPECGEMGELTMLDIRHVFDCSYPQWHGWIEPKEVYSKCGCVDNCCKKLTQLAKLFNDDSTSPVTAEAINIGEEWFLDVESKIAGVDFRVHAVEGLSEGDIIVPNYRQGYNAKNVKDWFGPDILGPCDGDKCLAAIEITYYQNYPTSGANGIATSDAATDTYTYESVRETAVIVFDPAITNSNAAKTALQTILAGTNEYNKRLVSTAAIDATFYEYCIIATDAGDATALATVRAAYTSNIVSINRAFYEGGKSYYTLRTRNATPPAAAGTNVVVLGRCDQSDLPCTVDDGCTPPEPEPEE